MDPDDQYPQAKEHKHDQWLAFRRRLTPIYMNDDREINSERVRIARYLKGYMELKVLFLADLIKTKEERDILDDAQSGGTATPPLEPVNKIISKYFYEYKMKECYRLTSITGG